MGKQGELIVGLDIGTTKICAIVGEVTDEGGIDIIGIGTHPSQGAAQGRGGQHRGHRRRPSAAPSRRPS